MTKLYLVYVGMKLHRSMGRNVILSSFHILIICMTTCKYEVDKHYYFPTNYYMYS